MTKEYLESISQLSDEASISSQSSGVEYTTKDSIHESSSEEFSDHKSKVPLVKQRKPQRTYRNKTLASISSDKDKRAESKL